MARNPRPNAHSASSPTGKALGRLCSLSLCRKRHRQLRATSGACSNIGRVRDSNDDLVFADDDCRVYMVLDGVSGRAGGGEAARILLDSLRTEIEARCQASTGERDLQSAVEAAIVAAGKTIQEIADRHPSLSRMATVFALAFVADNTLYYTHIGDSRIYLVRDGMAKQLTMDDTFVQALLNAHAIDAGDVKKHPMRHVISDRVGADHPRKETMVQSEPLIPGDKVLLTTDGITDSLEPDVIERVLSENRNSEEAAQVLVDAALEHGSQDNASCVVVTVDTTSKQTIAGNHDELHGELTKLHEILSDMDGVDDDLRADLEQVAADIRSALGASSDVSHLRGRLKDRILGFELKHPHLTGVVASITDMLACRHWDLTMYDHTDRTQRLSSFQSVHVTSQ